MLVVTDSATASRETEDDSAKQLKELREQFDAYRKEKAENDKILHQQLEEMREQTSSMRLDSAKLSSKVCVCVFCIIMYMTVHLYTFPGWNRCELQCS